MARIETYPPDYVITPNDKVIGTDGDNTNATKNFPVIAMLDYLGTNFNLQSADLVYNYTIDNENTLLDGQFTSNNRLDTTPLFANITTLYVSKTTVFGRLIDDYIQTVSDETYSFMIYDFANYNNFGFYSIVSAVSLNSDTFTLTVTFNSGNGAPIEGLSHGLKVYPPTGGVGGLQNIVEDITPELGGNVDMQGFSIESTVGGAVFSLLSTGGTRRAKSVWQTNDIYSPVNFTGSTAPNNPEGLFANFITGEWTIGANRILTTLDLGDFVTTNTTQTITGSKIFESILIDDALPFVKRLGNIVSSSQGYLYFKTDNTLNISVGTGTAAHNASIGGIDSFTATRSFTLQDKSGTLAHLDDIPAYSVPTQGTWTPTLTDLGGGATYSASSSCHYVRTGNLVHIYVNLTSWTTTGTPTGVFEMTLPFNSDLPFQPLVMGQLFYGSGGGSPSPSPTTQVIPHVYSAADNKIRLIEFPSTTNLQNKTWVTNGFLRFSGTYIAQP